MNSIDVVNNLTRQEENKEFGDIAVDGNWGSRDKSHQAVLHGEL